MVSFKFGMIAIRIFYPFRCFTGILLNLSGEDLSSVSPSFLASIMTLIPAILKIDADHYISELKRLAPKGKAATASGGADVPMDEEMNGNGHPECDQAEERKEEEEEEEEPVHDGSSNILPKCHRSKTLERLCDLLTAQQMALEILTNVCSAAGTRLARILSFSDNCRGVVFI